MKALIQVTDEFVKKVKVSENATFGGVKKYLKSKGKPVDNYASCMRKGGKTYIGKLDKMNVNGAVIQFKRSNSNMNRELAALRTEQNQTKRIPVHNIRIVAVRVSK